MTISPRNVCSVTGSIHAGTIAGFALQDRPGRVIGIDASARLAETRAQVEKIARNTAELVGLDRNLRDDEITVLDVRNGWEQVCDVYPTLQLPL